MKSILKITSLIAVFTLVLVAFAQQDGAAEAQATLQVAEHETLGEYLVDAQGRTLYVVVNEDEAVPCTGECATVWPPFLFSGAESMSGAETDVMGETGMMAGAGMDSSLIGTVQRDDGSTQVTYNGYPLYYFVQDVQPGDINCQAVEQFGGTWYVLSPQGEVITTTLTAGG